MSARPPSAQLRRRARRLGRPAARLRPWPTDASICHVLVADQHAAPSRHEIDGWVLEARRGGYRRLRTSAMYPAAAHAVLDAGFVVADELALLRLDLLGPDVTETSWHRTADVVPLGGRVSLSMLRGRHLDDAALVDQESFGIEWANDPSSLRDIRFATPASYARRARADGTFAGFAITGAGGRTGYLQRLAVAPWARRRGVATMLVTDSIRWMRQRGVAHALVNTGVDNGAALSLYARFGFRRLAERLTVAEYELGPSTTDDPHPPCGPHR